MVFFLVNHLRQLPKIVGRRTSHNFLAILSEEVFDLGKTMGGWKKKISQKNPPYF
mgnify:CR=1 FL=1